MLLVYNDTDIVGAGWLYSYRNNSLNVYADNYRAELFNEFESGISSDIYENETISNYSYIYLDHYNIQNDKFLLVNPKNSTDYVKNEVFTNNKDEIYDNGGFQVWKL